MIKLIIIISLFCSVAGANAQLTYEHTYDTGVTYWSHIVHFSSIGYKYVLINPRNKGAMIEVYNLNYSLYKQFAIPYQPAAGPYSVMQIEYVSDSLFNTNTATIKYLLYFNDTTGNVGHVRVYDDLGNTIFSRDSVILGWTIDFSYSGPVFYTPNGYKIILSEFDATRKERSYVYALPGALPCDECSNGNLIASAGHPLQGGNGSLMNAYPNPAKNSTTINYELPEGVNQGTLVFYDLQGRQIKTFTVDRTFNSILVSTTDLAAGTYFYVLRAGSNYVGSKQMVIIK